MHSGRIDARSLIREVGIGAAAVFGHLGQSGNTAQGGVFADADGFHLERGAKVDLACLNRFVLHQVHGGGFARQERPVRGCMGRG